MNTYYSIVKWVAHIALAIVAIGVGIMLYWLYSPPKEVITIHKLPVPVSPKPASPGQLVSLTYDYCKNANVNGKVYRWLVSDKTRLAAPVESDLTHAGCQKEAKVYISIPPQATPDTYHFHYRVIYEFNPFVIREQEWDSEKFEVK